MIFEKKKIFFRFLEQIRFKHLKKNNFEIMIFFHFFFFIFLNFFKKIR